MTDQLALDIHRMAGAIVRAVLTETGQLEDLREFRRVDWTIHHDAAEDAYVVSWPDGRVILGISADTLALAVGLLRAKHDAQHAALN